MLAVPELALNQVVSAGFCQFLQVSINDMAEFYSAFYGEEVTREQVADLGWECMQDEWDFNTAAGWTAADDKMSDCLVEEGIGPDNVFKFDVDAATIAAAKVRFDPRDELFSSKASG